ncbi:alpha/beta hydrolase [Paenibacillus koleovorans]|uniref:alpha/beta hydrolase n=1 Tax=Paenibacillus koleovorans TaxID=121608 RepID=UPI001FEABED9|nr:alpha/beta hydrolase [Paenibacillus koleovorans]
MAMQLEDLDWKCKDGTRMYAFVCQPELVENRDSGTSGIKGVIGIVHGMGEHTGRYKHVAERFTNAGYAVLLFDHRGHGLTQGLKGHTPDYESLLEGIDLLLAEAERRFPGVPRLLFGHSMGGNVTLNYVIRRKPQLAGALVTGPWLKLAFDPPKLQVAIGTVLERIKPTYMNNRPLRPENLTSHPDMIQSIREDKMRHGFISARFFFGVVRAGRYALQHAAEAKVPLYVMHGGEDFVTSIAASREFVTRAGDVCRFMEWPALRHELHNERVWEEVVDRMLEWFDERVDAVVPV